MNDLLPDPLLRELEALLPEESLLVEPADRWPYGQDNSRRHTLPGCVVLPREEREVVELVRLCRRFGVPLTARGRGTGTAGAAIPLPGGLLLSLERMDRILELDPADSLAVVQPGVTNAALQEAAAAHALFWPPDPTSAPFCTVGGNLACNSAGPRAVKYGTPRENTLGLRAVTGAGDLLECGVRTTKGVVGLDLTRLLIGSEGTLAVITEATLRLTPLPEARRTLRGVYRDIGAAAAAVSRIMAQPARPCALEFMDAAALALLRRHGDGALDLPKGAGAVLLIEVDGMASALDPLTGAVAAAAGGEGLLEWRSAADEEEAAELWRVRKALSPALRNAAPRKINEDVVVPVSRIPHLIEGLRRLSARHRILIVNFGHAGNGNIHVNLLFDPSNPGEEERAGACLDALFDLVLDLGGSLSGEHGVGREKREFVSRELSATALSLMRGIKREFDPDGILNPDKGLPDRGRG